MDEEYELTQILSYAPTQDKPGKNTRLVTSGLTKVTLPDTGNPLERRISFDRSCNRMPISGNLTDPFREAVDSNDIVTQEYYWPETPGSVSASPTSSLSEAPADHLS